MDNDGTSWENENQSKEKNSRLEKVCGQLENFDNQSRIENENFDSPMVYNEVLLYDDESKTKGRKSKLTYEESSWKFEPSKRNRAYSGRTQFFWSCGSLEEFPHEEELPDEEE